jgi:hypothetical protein
MDGKESLRKTGPRANAEADLLRRSMGKGRIVEVTTLATRRQVAKFRRHRPADSSCFPCMLVTFSQTKKKL